MLPFKNINHRTITGNTTMPRKIPCIFIVPPDGIITTQNIKGNFDLSILQKIVGGYVDIVPHFNKYGEDRCIVFCNEDGKMRQLPVNRYATILLYASCWPSNDYHQDHLVGTIAIVAGPREISIAPLKCHVCWQRHSDKPDRQDVLKLKHSGQRLP